MRRHTVLITEAELVASPPERVYGVLEARAVKRDRNDEGFDQDIEKGLLDRNDPLIDLALAKFCKYGETAATLFNRAPAVGANGAHEQALRLAVLSNAYLDSTFSIRGIPVAVFDSDADAMSAWLSRANDAELFALFTNPSINQTFLRDFLEGKAGWDAMDEQRRFLAIQFLSSNNRMSESYSGDMDGYAEYSHDSVFFAAWKLAETLPPTRKWAMALGGLLNVIRCHALHMDDPLAIAERWKPAANDKDGQEDEAKLPKNGYAWGYPLVRKSLAHLAGKQKPELKRQMLKHADPAVRDAAYTFFEMKPDDILAAYDMDKNLAVNSCQRNDFVWRTPDNRKALHDISWKACGELNNNYMDSANAYNYQEERQKNLHPNWFEGEDDDDVDKSDFPATKADIEALTEAVGGNEYLIRESTKLMNQKTSAINDRLGWVWWFALGALAASLWHRF